MNIFVINLEKDVDRRTSITQQLENLGLAYEIVKGIYGAALTREELNTHYKDRKAKLRMARSLVPSEIGCALSHLKVYQEIVERGIGCALVLEDDVILPSQLGGLLADYERMIDVSRPEVWLLSPAVGNQASPNARLLRTGQQVLPYKGGYYSSSYLVTEPAARVLLAELYPVCDVADCWQRMHRYRVVDLYVVSPPLIVQNRDEFGSSTTSGIQKAIHTNPLFWFTYKPRRALSIIFELFYAPYRRLFRPYSGIKLERSE